jgi:hypothetical protein
MTKKEEQEVLDPIEKTSRETFLTQLKFLKALDDHISKKVSERVKSLPPDPYESDKTEKIHEALAKAQGEFKPIGYNKENPYFKNKYADFDSIVKITRPALAKNGLSVTQQTVLHDTGSTVLVTRLRHNSGQWIETRARIVPTKNDAQSYASALTYMKRYSFMALLNITTSDDTSDDDAERVMYDVRTTKAKGVALNTKYNPKEQSSMVITKEQLDELEYELGDYDDIADMVLEGLKIQSLADMPKDKYLASVTRIREIKNAREGLD